MLVNGHDNSKVIVYDGPRKRMLRKTRISISIAAKTALQMSGHRGVAPTDQGAIHAASCVAIVRLRGGCGMPSKVALEGTVMFTVAEFDKLSDDEKKDLEFAARAVTQKHVGHLRDQLRKVMTHDRN